MVSCRSWNGIGGTRTGTAGSCLGAGAGIVRMTGIAAGYGVIGGGQDSFQVPGAAMGTGHLHLLLLIHHQELYVLVTVKAFEFEYGHFNLLM